MGRNVFLSKNIIDNISERISGTEFQLGFLIGQQCDSAHSKDAHVVHWCPTPGPGDAEAPSSLLKLDAEGVAHHAAQVVRMLPGGISLLGVYVAGPKFNSSAGGMTKRAPQMQRLLSSLHRVCQASALNIKATQDRMLVLNMCSKTLQSTCQSFSCSTSASLSEAVNVQVEADAGKWIKVLFSYDLDLLLRFSAAQTKKQTSIHVPVMRKLVKWAEHVSNSLAVVIGGKLCLAGDDSPLSACFDSNVDVPGTVECHILEQLNGSSNNSDAGDDVAASITITGNIIGQAFVHEKSSVGSLVAAVSSDVCGSVHARWSLHCDSLSPEDESAYITGNSVMQKHLPRRATITVPELPFAVYDYLFPGDTASDVCQSVMEVLNLSATPEHVDQNVETCPDLIECSVKAAAVGQACARPPLGSTQLQVAALLATVAVLVAYLLFAR